MICGGTPTSACGLPTAQVLTTLLPLRCSAQAAQIGVPQAEDDDRVGSRLATLIDIQVRGCCWLCCTSCVGCDCDHATIVR